MVCAHKKNKHLCVQKGRVHLDPSHCLMLKAQLSSIAASCILFNLSVLKVKLPSNLIIAFKLLP